MNECDKGGQFVSFVFNERVLARLKYDIKIFHICRLGFCHFEVCIQSNFSCESKRLSS